MDGLLDVGGSFMVCYLSVALKYYNGHGTRGGLMICSILFFLSRKPFWLWRGTSCSSLGLWASMWIFVWCCAVSDESQTARFVEWIWRVGMTERRGSGLETEV